MMAKDNATDDLTQLVARMNAATGEAKTAAIAELLTRLVQQQTTMRTTMDESMKAMKSERSMMKKRPTPISNRSTDGPLSRRHQCTSR